MRDHLLLTASIGGILLLATLLVGVVSQRASDSPRPSFTAANLLQSRRNLLRYLDSEEYGYRSQQTQLLAGVVKVQLTLRGRADVVDSLAQLDSWHMEAPSARISPVTSIVDAYNEASMGLLLLGAPGAGKTLLLVELARELLTRAEQDSQHPLPLIVNLSSWAMKRLLLADWLKEQLWLDYRIPADLSQSWIEQDQFLLLLDGLDEVDDSARTACIEAINTYRREHFVPLVVCSRSQKYLAQPGRPIAHVPRTHRGNPQAGTCGERHPGCRGPGLQRHLRRIPALSRNDAQAAQTRDRGHGRAASAESLRL